MAKRAPKALFVARPRVEKAIVETARSTPLTLIQAPLGSGKSVALSAALAQVEESAFLDVRVWHRGAFVEPLVSAVRHVRPDFGRRTLGALEAGATPAALGALFATDLTNVSDPLIIAIDSVEHLADDDDFAEFLAPVLDRLPAEVHIILAGRTHPKLQLATALVRRQATLLGPELLAFSNDEIRALAAATAADADQLEIDRIASETDGWATSVALHLEARPVRAPAGADLARAFLAEALLPRLPPSTLAFLEETAVYDVLDAELVRADEAAVDFERAISDLERAGAPIVQTRPSSYRVHALVRALALDRLRKRGGDSAAHSRASAAFAAAGDLSAALFHAIESNDEATLDALLRGHADALARTSNTSALKTALHALGRPQSSDIQWYVQALLAKSSGDERASELFERARDAADRLGDKKIAFAARAQLIERELGRLQPVHERELTDLEERAGALEVPAQAQAIMYRGWQRAVNHDFRGAVDIVETLRALPDMTARFNTGVLWAYAQVAQGEIDAGLAEMDGLVRLFEDNDRVGFQTLALIWQSRLALVGGRTTLAGDTGRSALRLVETLSIRAEEAALYVALAELATHEGDVDATVRYAERASKTAPHAWYVADVERTRVFSDIALARAAFLGHDNAIARDLALRAARSTSAPVQQAIARTEASVYGLLIDAEKVSDLLIPARDALSAAKPVDAADAVMLATASDLLAFVSAANGLTLGSRPAPAQPFAQLVERRRGLVTLEHAGIALANLRSGNGTQVAFDLALERATAQGPRFEVRLARAYASRFVRVATETVVRHPEYDLTSREHEILTLLVDGLSNKEIAQRLVLSPRTAETHVEHVLGKLGVPSRSRAIAKALRLGLVSLPAD